jgi:hypothetical protein
MLTEQILDEMTNHDLAVLADWAGRLAHSTPNKNWKRAYALIREGSDLLLRRRARSTVEDCETNHKGSDPNHADEIRGKIEKDFQTLSDLSLGQPIIEEVPEVDSGNQTGCK